MHLYWSVIGQEKLNLSTLRSYWCKIKSFRDNSKILSIQLYVKGYGNYTTTCSRNLKNFKFLVNIYLCSSRAVFSGHTPGFPAFADY